MFLKNIAISKAKPFRDIRVHVKCFGEDCASIFRAVQSVRGTSSRRMQQENVCL